MSSDSWLVSSLFHLALCLFLQAITVSLSSLSLSTLGNSADSSASLDFNTFLLFCFYFFFFGLLTVSPWSDKSSVRGTSSFFSFFFFPFLLVATLSDWQLSTIATSRSLPPFESYFWEAFFSFHFRIIQCTFRWVTQCTL